VIWGFLHVDRDCISSFEVSRVVWIRELRKMMLDVFELDKWFIASREVWMSYVALMWWKAGFFNLD
jgi:hypothetical protein